MSDSDEDLFGSGDEGVAKVSPSPGAAAAAAVAVAAGATGDDSDDNLFGSDNEEQPKVVGGLAGLENEDDMEVEAATTTEEDKLTAILGTKSEKDTAGALHKKPRTSGKMYLPTAPAFAEDSAEKMYVRVPEVLRIQSDGYEKQSYDAEEEIKDFMVSFEKRGKMQVSEAIISDVVRWRAKVGSDGAPIIGADGNPVKESNARLQKLKSGGYRVIVGNSVYEAPTVAIARSYVFRSSQSNPPVDAVLSAEEEASGVSLNTSTNLKCAASLEGSYRMNLQAHTSNTMATAIMQQGNKTRFGAGGPRIKREDNRKIVERPEVVYERQLREEEARLRAAKKASESENGADGNRAYGRIGMSTDYLMADGETHFDDINIGDIKKGGKAHGKRGRGKAAPALAYDELSDDDDEDGFLAKSGDEDDEDSEDEAPETKNKGRKLQGKRKAAASDEDSDDNVFSEDDKPSAAGAASVEDEEDEEEAGPVKKRARQNVVDDDDE